LPSNVPVTVKRTPPELVILVAFKETLRADEDDEYDSTTFPWKPFTGVSVIVELALAPVGKGPIMVGVTVRVKSTTFTETVTGWFKTPEMPVTTTV